MKEKTLRSTDLEMSRRLFSRGPESPDLMMPVFLNHLTPNNGQWDWYLGILDLIPVKPNFQVEKFLLN